MDMTAKTNQAEQLQQMLALELVSVEQLKKILHQEKQALIENNQDLLIDLAERKSTLLEAIDRRHQESTSWMKETLHLEPRGDSLTQWITSLPEAKASELSQLWSRLKKSLLKVQADNQVNGALLSRLAYKNRFMLSLLSGQSQENPIYGAQGRETSGGSHGTLGKA